VILITKKCAFCWNNNCIIVNLHGKTTIKTNVKVKVLPESILLYTSGVLVVAVTATVAIILHTYISDHLLLTIKGVFH
jgi:hypothetical protein